MKTLKEYYVLLSIVPLLTFLLFSAIFLLPFSGMSRGPVQEYNDIASIIDQFATKPGDSSFIETEAFAKTLSRLMSARFVRSDGKLRTASGLDVTLSSLPDGRYLILFKGLSRSTCRLVVRNVIDDARSPQSSAGTPALTVDTRYNKGDFQAPCGSDQRLLALEGQVPGSPAPHK